MLGLPDGVTACLFDMDGVVTQTAVVHAAAWKEMFDEFLRENAKKTGTEFVPFDNHEYDEYVDGKPRLDGTRSWSPATSTCRRDRRMISRARRPCTV
jgi:beta-phosphoglucomutase-like phosphatase (HAD superfamily)